MAFSPAFETSQTLGAAADINFTDVSTGSDGAITQRRIYIQQADGTFLVPAGISTQYNAWALADTSITIEDILTTDVAVIVTVQWLDVSNSVLYDSQQLVGYTSFEEQGDYQLTQWWAANPVNISDNYFFVNKSKLRDCIDSGNQAINFFSDLYAAQQCYDAGMEIVNNARNLFNTNQ